MAPALRSLVIRQRDDVADILEFLFHKRGDLRKQILKCRWLGDNGSGLLANIVSLYPGLEFLSLEGCNPLTTTSYCLLLHVKKLCELKVSNCEVYYACVKMLETHFCICQRM